MGRSEETDAQRWLGDLSWIIRQKVGIVSKSKSSKRKSRTFEAGYGGG